MKKVSIRNPEINKKLLDHQLFWLELWEELLNPYTIEPHSAPLINLYWMMYEFNQTNDTKDEELKRRLNEIKFSQFGIKYDLIAKDLASQLPLLFDISEQSHAFVKIRHDFRDLNKCGNTLENSASQTTLYFLTLCFKLYQILSLHEHSSFKDRKFWKQLEFLSKSFIAELLNRRFSWHYLMTRPAIFTQKSNYLKGNFQFKLNHLFSELMNSGEEWTSIFKISIKKDVRRIQDFQGIAFATDDNDFIKNLKEQLSGKRYELERRIDFFKSNSKKYIIEEIFDNYNPLTKLNLDKSFYSDQEIEIAWEKLKPIIEERLKLKQCKLSHVLPNVQQLRKFSIENNYYSVKGFNYQVVQMSSDQLLHRIKEEQSILNWQDSLRVMLYIISNGDKIRESIFRTNKKLEFLYNSQNRIFGIVKRVFAPDPIAALIIGKNRLLRLLNIIRYNSEDISFTANSIDRNSLLISDYRVILQGREPRINRRECMKFQGTKISLHLNRIKVCKQNELQSNFQNIMHWYGMHLDAQYDAEKFLSLWIGLEKMLSNSETRKIGETISESTSKIVSLYYLRKVLRNFWLDISRLNLSKQLSSTFEIEVENSRVNESDLFFAIKFKASEMKEKIETLINGKLIRTRLTDLENIFSTADNLANWIRSYNYHVNNSMWRLYSMRNKIAHEAYVDADLSPYLKQLNYFFRICYDNLLYVASKNKSVTLENFIQLYSQKYNEIWDREQRSLVYMFYDLLKEKDIKRLHLLKVDLKNILIDPPIL
ncbi:MAG: hypothetical protein GF353_04630 [Candidatus Lokiarchaeota archaeon]|nr:hypothetical protein [Candidatus Lokiarchaeota archaeon]